MGKQHKMIQVLKLLNSHGRWEEASGSLLQMGSILAIAVICRANKQMEDLSLWVYLLLFVNMRSSIHWFTLLNGQDSLSWAHPKPVAMNFFIISHCGFRVRGTYVILPWFPKPSAWSWTGSRAAGTWTNACIGCQRRRQRISLQSHHIGSQEVKIF